MHAAVALAFIFAAAAHAEEPFNPPVSTAPVIRSVAILGTRQPVTLATQVGQPYNARIISEDVHKLWSMERFEDIRVETTPHGD